MGPRTRAQLRDAMAARQTPAEVAEVVLERLVEVGLVDDEAFAHAWVRSRHTGRGLARRALAQELHRKGIDDELSRSALDALDPAQERDTARALVQRRLPTTRGLTEQARTRRLAAMLARRGYPSGVAFAVVRDVLASAGD